MNRLAWEFQRARWRLGMPGLLAFVLIAAALVILLAEIVPLRRDEAERRSDLAAREEKLKEPPPPLAEEAPTEVSADRRFFVFLHGFHAMAERAALTIPQISYQVMDAKEDKSTKRYLLETTFTSTYLQMRSFLAELRRVPGVRCERLTISRQTIAATQLDIKLQCLFLVEVTS